VNFVKYGLNACIKLMQSTAVIIFKEVKQIIVINKLQSIQL